MSKIVFIDKNVVVINKDAGISSQPDNTDGSSALENTAKLLKSLNEPYELYPVHRLDKVVGGLLIFARNKRTAAILSESVADGDFSKNYVAVVEGKPEEGEYCDYLLKNSVLSKAQIVSPQKKGAKEAKLILSRISTVKTEKGEKSLVKITLLTGRFHQIRAQLSGRCNSIVGDKKYGNKDGGARFPALFAYKISLKTGDLDIKASSLPDTDSYPWNLFEKELYEELIK